MIIVIGGPTASGKSGLAVAVAQKLSGEVVSADSMQIYRDMNVGTAKITETETRGIPHHLIDVVDAEKSFSVAQFAETAKNTILDIQKRGKVPVVCGGTGLYINSLLYDYQMSPYDPDLRSSLQKELHEKGIEELYQKLLSLDPMAERIDKRNEKRVIRALEVVLTEGKSILDKSDKESTIQHLMFALEVPRDILYDRINKRVDEMFKNGLIDEVNGLLSRGISFENQSMQAIGYKECKAYFSGEIDLNTLKELIKQHTRNYAKRQITWFKRIPSCIWLKYDEYDKNLDFICNEYYKYSDKIE